MNNKAFTLIEIILYTAIFAIVGGLVTGILLTVTQVQQRESASAEVTGQLNFVMQTVQRLVRESSNIEIEAGIATSTLKLRMQDSAKDPTCIFLVDGVIKLAEGPGSNPNDCTTEESDLTNSRVIVDTFNFKKFTQYPGHDTVSIDLTITYNSTNPKSQVQRTLSSAIARVSAATFDSDVVPGGTYDFTLGQAGAPWLKTIVADGTAANPSYTFANNTGLGLFRAGASILGFTTAGSERMRIDASGNVGIGTTNPEYKMDINGALRLQLSSQPTGANGVMYYDLTENKFKCYQNEAWGDCGGAGFWETSEDDIYNINSGNVDIIGALSLSGMSTPPPVAPAGQGRIYFDLTDKKIKVSEDSAPYVDLVASPLFLYNDVHTSDDCQLEGGLIRPIGSGNYLCEIEGLSCPSEWTQLLNWGSTGSGVCGIPECRCTTGCHNWANIARETCTYYTTLAKYCENPATCYAPILTVGCY